MKSILGTGLLGSAAGLFLVCWVLSVVSTSVSDWVWLWSAKEGPHEGLWSSCWSGSCTANNGYSGGCLAMLNLVRAFSILTITFGSLSIGLTLYLIVRESALWVVVAVLCALLTVGFSVPPWAVYLGFTSHCVISTVTKGSGWCLAVAAFSFATIALACLLLWVCIGRGSPLYCLSVCGSPRAPSEHCNGSSASPAGLTAGGGMVMMSSSPYHHHSAGTGGYGGGYLSLTSHGGSGGFSPTSSSPTIAVV